MHILSTHPSEASDYFHALTVAKLSDPPKRLLATYPTRDDAIQAVQQILCRSPQTDCAAWAVLPTKPSNAWGVMTLSVIPADAHYYQGLLSHTVWAEVLGNICLSDTVVLCRTRYALFSWTS